MLKVHGEFIIPIVLGRFPKPGEGFGIYDHWILGPVWIKTLISERADRAL